MGNSSVSFLNKQITLLHNKHASSTNEPQTILTDEDLHIINQLQKDFIITYVDKSPKDFAFICKQYYYDTIYKELSSTTYTRLSDTPDQVTEKQFNLLSSLGFTPSKRNNKQSSFYMAYKCHKDHWCFIVGANKSPLKQLS